VKKRPLYKTASELHLGPKYKEKELNSKINNREIKTKD
jgi:hypothetical protein